MHQTLGDMEMVIVGIIAMLIVAFSAVFGSNAPGPWGK
jgi:hypothetical protein